MKNEEILGATAGTTGSVTPDIYLFKLAAGKYENEYTKNCGLLGQEIDQNFHFLNGMDVTGFSVESQEKKDSGGTVVGKENILSIKLRNGNNYTINLTEETSQYKFSYNPNNGILTITGPDGSEQKISGFLVEGQDFKVVTDGTLDGNGTKLDPLSINPTLLTGVYSPVKRFVDLSQSGGPRTLEEFLSGNPEYVLARHLRFLTKESVNSLGYLYTYNGAQKIVEEVGDGWRIPTKQDWDEMLNGLEHKYEQKCSGFTCESSHFSDVDGAELGCKAGLMLRSPELWNEQGIPGTNDFDFEALGVGTGDNDRRSTWFNENSFGYETKFWTSSKKQNDDESVWLKTLTYNKPTVGQETEKIRHEMYSLRLVKNDIWDGTDIEILCGVNTKCCNMPYIDKDGGEGTRLWTAQNIAIPLDGQYANESIYPLEWEELMKEYDYRNNQPGFFVCEWNGYEWRKRQARDGESVIVLDTDSITGKEHEGKEYGEYRVEWIESAQTFVLINVLDAYRDEMSATTAGLIQRINNLENKVNEFSASTVQEFARVDETIITFSASTIQEFVRVDNTISEFSSSTIQEFARVDEKIDIFSASTIQEINRIDNTINDLSASTIQEINRIDSTIVDFSASTMGEFARVDSTISEFSSSTIQEFARVDEKIDIFSASTIQEINRIDNTIIDFSASTVNTIDKFRKGVGLEDDFTPDFRKFKYVVEPDITKVVDPVLKDEVIENPTASDPMFIIVGLVAYRKTDIAKYIVSAKTVVDAVKTLDVSLQTIEKEAQERAEEIFVRAVTSARTYTDTQFTILDEKCDTLDAKIEAVKDELDEKIDNVKEELNDKIDSAVTVLSGAISDEQEVRASSDLALQRQILANKIIRSTTISTASTSEGTKLNVIIPDYDINATNPEHLRIDGNGLYFDGYFGKLPNEITSGGGETVLGMVKYTVKKHKLIEASGITVNDFNEAQEASVNTTDKTAKLIYHISPVGVAGYINMSEEEQMEAKESVCSDLIIFTNNTIKDILPNDMASEEEMNSWEINKYTVSGLKTSTRYDGNQCVIFDPDDFDVVIPDELELNYTIKFE